WIGIDQFDTTHAMVFRSLFLLSMFIPIASHFILFCVGVLFNPKLGIPHLEEGQGNLILVLVGHLTHLLQDKSEAGCLLVLDNHRLGSLRGGTLLLSQSLSILCRVHLDQSITDYASTSLIERISSNPLSSISWPVLCQAHLDQSIVDYVLASPCRAPLGQSFVKHISTSPLPTTSRGGTSPTKQAMEGLIPFLYRAIVSYTDGVRPRSAWYTRLPDESGRLLSSETLYSSSLAATTQPSSAPQSPGAALPEDYRGDRGRRRGLP
ncbi:hypothetical protein BHM03_00049592, partial [Ensete ventricosum]